MTDVVVGPVTHGLDHHIPVADCGGHDGGAGRAIGTHLLKHIKPVHLGHFVVEQYQVKGVVGRLCCAQLFHTQPTIQGVLHGVAFAFEIDADQFCGHLVVFHVENVSSVLGHWAGL